MADKCSKCGKKIGFFDWEKVVRKGDKLFCGDCASKIKTKTEEPFKKMSKEAQYFKDKIDFYNNRLFLNGIFTIFCIAILIYLVYTTYLGNGFFIVTLESIFFFILSVIGVFWAISLRQKRAEAEFELKQKQNIKK